MFFLIEISNYLLIKVEMNDIFKFWTRLKVFIEIKDDFYEISKLFFKKEKNNVRTVDLF